jgi:hypothetical protein
LCKVFFRFKPDPRAAIFQIERKRAVVGLGFVPRLTKLLTGRQCSAQVRGAGEQLLKGFSEFLGWESKYASSSPAASPITANLANGDEADLGIFAPLLPCIAPIIESLRAVEEMFGLA